jgi:hypothetical protein
MDNQTPNYIYSGKNKTVPYCQKMRKITRQKKSQIITDYHHDRETKSYTDGLIKQKMT